MVSSLLSLGVPPGLAAANEADFSYSPLGEGTAVITGYTGSSKDVVIPGTINGLTVVSIGDNAFLNKGITSVTIPSSVTSIGSGAFYKNQLTSVEIPSSVTSIGDWAFAYNFLTSVEIPSSVTSIGSGAFNNNKLTSVNIPESVNRIESGAFDDNPLIYVVIPNNTIIIANSSVFGNNATIIASDSSKGKSHADNRGHPFIDIQDANPDRILIQSVGGGDYWGTVTVTVNSPYLPNAYYQWSKSSILPAFSADDWTAFTSGNTISTPSEEGRWYLHVLAKTATGGSWALRSEALLVDLVSPVIRVGQVPNGWFSQMELGISVEENESGVDVVKYLPGQLDAEDFADVGEPVALTDNQGTIKIGENGWHTIYAKDKAGNEAVERIEIMNIDSDPPLIDLSPSTTEPTNRDVVVTVSVTDDKSGVKATKWAAGERETEYFTSAGTAFSGSFTVTANGTYTVYAEDAAGNAAVKTIAIANIFKTGPSIDLEASTDAPTNRPITVTVDVQAEAGVDEVKYDFDDRDAAYFQTGGTTLDTSNPRITVTDNGRLTVYARDRAGNEAVESIRIDNIDYIPPTILALTPSVTEPTNQDVVVTVVVTDDGSGVTVTKWVYGQYDETYFLAGGTPFSGGFSAPMNGTYTVYAEDAAGNNAVATITIANIFKTVPSILLTPAPTEPANRAVTVTVFVHAESGLAEVKYAFGKLDAADFATTGTTLDTSDPQITVESNGWLTVYARDKAGNEAVQRIEIGNIDYIPPSIVELTPSTTEPTNQDVVVTANVMDDKSGVKATKWAAGERETEYFTSAGTAFSGSFTVTANGTYTVYAEDAAGNAAVKTIAIANIFKTGPTIGLEPSTESLTNQPVTVTVGVQAEAGVDVVKYDFDDRDAAYFQTGGTTLDTSEPQIIVESNGWLTVYARDRAGNEAIRKLEVRNLDLVKPVITLIGDAEIRVPLGSAFTDPGYTAFDNRDQDITEQVRVSGDTVDTSAEGVYTILYDVRDRAGNDADQVSRIVQVYRPSTGPVVTAPGSGTGTPAAGDEPAAPEEPAEAGESVAEEPTERPAEQPRDNPETTVPAFRDAEGHWAAGDIRRAAEMGLVSGYPDGTMQPNRPITRAEFLVLLIRALDLIGSGEAAGDGATTAGSSLSFTDADRIGAWAREAIARAVGLGITSGYPDGTFRPGAPITRAEMAVMIARALGLTATESGTGFADDADIPAWAKGAVEVLRKQNLLQGRNDSRFAPNESATRAEVVVMLLRMLDMRE